MASQARRELGALLELLGEADRRWLGPEWGIEKDADAAEGARALLHLLAGGLDLHLEEDPERPRFRRIVSPSRKLMGDNADAIYYDAPIRPDRRYRVRGRRAGAVYMSLTVEAGAADGRLGARTAGVLNDTEIDFDAEGRFEVRVGGEPGARNWLGLPADASRITTRHYFEEERPAAADPTRRLELEIDPLDPPPPPSRLDDTAVAAGIRRVANFVRSRTLELGPPGSRAQPAFVSTVPNTFPAPVPPGDHALAAADAAYSMAPYVLGPEEALVLTGRWPACRFANVSLWNRHLMTYDYATRRVSLNRRQTRLEPDGSFRIVIAHRDPGTPNWLDTEGRPFGLVFWRYLLPEGAIDTPRAAVTRLADLP